LEHIAKGFFIARGKLTDRRPFPHVFPVVRNLLAAVDTGLMAEQAHALREGAEFMAALKQP
jgi:hypothetical protein